MRKYFIALFFVVMPILCFSETINSQKIKQLISSYERYDRGEATNEDTANAHFLMGYVYGIADISDVKFLCLPQGVSIGQMTAIAIKYFNTHPQHWHYNPSAIFLASLATSFPCEKKK